MKKLLFIFCFLGVLTSCSDNDNDNPSNALIGEWILSEILNDPGDGSGIFVKVESNKRLVFKENNTVTSNGNLCVNTPDSDASSAGTYKLNENFTTSGVIETGCYSSHTDYVPKFNLVDGILYLAYFCDEPCQAKYIKK